MLLLLTDRNFYQYYHEKEHKLIESIAPEGAHMWSRYMPQQAVENGTREFQHHNGIFILKKHRDYVEKIELAAHPDSIFSAMDICCNHPDLLNKFLFYFKEAGENLIHQALEERFSIPETMLYENIFNNNHNNYYADFLDQIKTKKIRLTFRDGEILFSPREFDCLSLLCEGKTIKGVANILNVSPKTAEEYLSNAKKKVKNCYTRSQLITDFCKSLFIVKNKLM